MAKGNLLNNALACGASSFLFLNSLLPFKAEAKTIANLDCEVGFKIPGVRYTEYENPTTKVNVKVDLDNAGVNEYSLNISLLAKDWNKKLQDLPEYTLIYGPGSRICLAYPENIVIDNPKENIYFVRRMHPNNKAMDGFWEEVYSLEESRNIRVKLKIMKKFADFFSLFGLGKEIYYATELGDIKTANSESAREIFNKMGIENAKYAEIPFYPHNFRNVTARKFEIPVFVKKNTENDRISAAFNVNLTGGQFGNESFGSLERLLIEIPVNDKIKNEESDKKIEWGYEELRQFIENEVGQCYAIEYHPQSNIDDAKGNELVVEAPYHKNDREYFDATKLLILNRGKEGLKKTAEIELPYHPLYSLKLFDWDEDGKDDIFAYYCDRNGENERITVHSCKDGEYKKIGDVKDFDPGWKAALKKEK